MKKLILVFILVLGLALPLSAKAATKSLNLKEALQEEHIELSDAFETYKETDDQAIIYMFRGQGCGYCRAFLEFMNSISKEYGKYFKMVSFEVWNDANNADLLEKVPLVTNKAAGGVPYIIIGEKVFAGYASTYDEEIKEAIMKQYKDNSYDVMEKLDERLNGKTNSTSSFAVIFWNAFFVIAATVALILVNNKNTEKVLNALEKKENKKNK